MIYKTIILTGPSAIGKTFISKLLISNYPDLFEHAAVYTTRPKRRVESKISLERIFISDEEFNNKVNLNEFVIYEEFAGYKYGYTAEAFSPKNKHLLVDVSPWQIQKLLDIDTVFLVGLQAPKNYKVMLDNRMKSRGDSFKVRIIRREFITKDVEDLQKIKPIIDLYGKFFVVYDDSTIPNKVISYIFENTV